ncbi:LysR family transcriptional regulator [Pseudomonas sp. JS3066]|uniref:LysR family transcriptional regulator n=1 Tax=unclassified Pseudomonas TaxID=196821 RepID=UPI000EA9B1FB|nr:MULTISPECIES: LysR family transcriptional regulator [unclassified Pseudomonas]AYF90766.1 LysR family transcriptional regulator [Pseudomonas sp. DY-1]MDH4654840.1 LysR family transcriptional regulator [Pseudomonas sp. BN606]WVK96104.1 LysR family transcriptional regulator [Pseudomonas sp. JS3066]
MRFSLDQLQVLVTVAQAGSFSAAARRLGRTQSTVSAAIANLETDLGVELFDRSTRIPALTAAGQKLLLEAEAVLERCLALEGHADSLTVETEPSLTLAIEVPYNTVMPVLRDFEQVFPYVDLVVRHPVYGDVAGMVQKGEVEMGIAFSQPEYPRELEFQQLGKLIMVHVTHPSHPLAQLAQVSFADLHAHRRLAFSAHANKLPSSEYLRSTQLWQAESYMALLEMVRAGLGWATLPRQLIHRELAVGDLMELDLVAYPHTDWLVGVDLIWPRRQGRGKAKRWLRERLMRNKVFELDSQGKATTL